MRNRKKPAMVSHLKNSIRVKKGTKESSELKGEGSKVKKLRNAKVFGEINFKIPDGRGSIWNKIRIRKRESRTVNALMRKCVDAGMGECGDAEMRKFMMNLSIAKRTITNRMPNSMRE